MPTITIRVDDATRDDLEELAKTEGIPLSVLVRTQIDTLLGREVEMLRSDAPHALSMQQRLLLANQHEILARISQDDYEAGNHRRMVQVLQEGFAGEYGDLFGGLYPEMPRAECAEVWDILDMFRILGFGLKKLTDEQLNELGDDAEDLVFQGFDMNDSTEARMLGYVRYLVSTDRWSEIQACLEDIGDDGNSHATLLPKYRRMLVVHRATLESRRASRGYGMSNYAFEFDELQRIATA